MICIANWKMNQGFQAAQTFLQEFKSLLQSEDDKQNFIFLPPAFLAGLFKEESFYWGAQDICNKTQGAFTGENSAKTLLEMGAQFCLLGHSERRYGFGESEVEIEQKFHLMQDLGLIPILCVGETESERNNKALVFKRQLAWLRTYVKYEKLPWKPEARPKPFKDMPFIVAYEPVWAIGTGATPSQQEMQDSCEIIKEYLHLKNTPILYGGSVNKDNAEVFYKQKYLDGFLIGGASLKAQEFYSIYKQSQQESSIISLK